MGFGNFTELCQQASIPLCTILTNPIDKQLESISIGVIPKCYARSIILANTMIFQIGTAFINIGALILVVVILFNIKSKYTAIGRNEMIYFFEIIFILSFLSLIVDCGVVPPGSDTFKYFVAIQNGFSSMACWTLMITGLTGFEIWEDGKKKAMFLLRLSSLVFFALSFIISLFTFQNWFDGINLNQTVPLFIVLYIINAVFVLVYIISQLILSLFILDNIWAFGAFLLGVCFFIAGQVLLYALSNIICEGCNHYLDSLFFTSLANVFTYMMLFKYWDMITLEDLEFSVASNENPTDPGMGLYHDDDKSSIFTQLR
ncbi:Chs7p ASCRUDRAFT_35546 [Ascoidea rubescens DSM 1968]|uniref:Chitin synthase export chaperone n=1 Tax=Ascoidea rubescens DSM 1968 TaxID=1344418 RepID=A0A1D2VGI4_9ASCO|nr:hypothetical protein ASCRUDRAFT_35546 [Ascoidea rubescens DSM 1968]ODV60746.1 hypothetical protein ASCRUDRAFT_35546 [Ascoidea rubescens DSM 1968]